MAYDGDPYRILGLSREASLDEVKRAYRRLAKANHPDAAGSEALNRFLAIQSAYEQLVEGAGGRVPKPRGSTGAGAPRHASEADPDRADATRRAYGGRTRARRPADGGTGRRPPAGSSAGSSAGDRQPGDADASRSADPEAGRRRGKATLGSTSYDDAMTGPFEPDWGGASWYGTTSGTYWTINPKEYADPRKHGPEYQARARRAAGPSPAADDRPAAGGSPTPHRSARSGAGERPPEPAHEPPSWWTTTSGPSEPASGSDPGSAAWQPLDEAGPADADAAPDPARALANLARALMDPRAGGLRGRAIRAVAGWLPIALGIGWLLGEVTGCGRFAATCNPAIDPLVLVTQGVALVALLISPRLASAAAAAALGSLVAAVAATLFLSATGAATDPASGRLTLAALLAIGWGSGLLIAIAQRVRAVSSRAGPVS